MPKMAYKEQNRAVARTSELAQRFKSSKAPIEGYSLKIYTL